MGTIKDAIDAMQKVILLNDKVERAGQALSGISDEIRQLDRRVTRLEAFVEIAKTQQGHLPTDTRN